jgi:Flp pilus assembly protein TadD
MANESGQKHHTGAASRDGRVFRWWAAAVFVFAWLLYANTLGNDFVWDDRTLIVENTDVRSLDGEAVKRAFTTHYWAMKDPVGGLYRPLSTLSFHADYRLYGADPRGYHLTNSVLNALVCALAFLLILELFGNFPLAFVASLLFAAFPTHTESVAWVAGRTDLIATLFMVLSLCSYVWWRRRGGWWRVVASVAAFTLAVLGKEFALVLPPVIVAMELGPFARLRREGERAGIDARRLCTVAILYFGAAALFFVARRAVLGASVLNFQPVAHGVVQTTALALSTLAHYCYHLAFPFLLNAESEFPVPDTLANVHSAAGLVLLLLFAVALRRWRRRGEVVLGIAVLVVGLAPVLNVFPITEVSAERFLYFPSLGFCLLAATLAMSARARWRSHTTAILALVVVAYGVRTTSRNMDWRDESTLFTKTVAAADENARAHLNLGNVHYRAGRPRDALSEYRQAIDIDPDYAEAWSGSAGAYKELGQLDEAFACMKRALEINPANANFHSSLGVLYVQRGEFEAAIASFRDALARDPAHARARFNLGLAMYNNEDYRDAIEAFAPLENKDTDYMHAYYYMALSASKLGDRARAAEFAATFLSLYDHDDDYRRGAQALLSGGP